MVKVNYLKAVSLEQLTSKKDAVLKEMTEATAGKCKLEDLGSRYELLL